jgi:hypothetical protein
MPPVPQVEPVGHYHWLATLLLPTRMLLLTVREAGRNAKLVWKMLLLLCRIRTLPSPKGGASLPRRCCSTARLPPS